MDFSSRILILFLFSIVHYVECQVIVGTVPTVVTGGGITYSGAYVSTAKSNWYARFQGIRFGAPPVGTLRFKDPVPANVLPGVYNVSQPGSLCPQLSGGNVIGSEDCLNLNVLAPVFANQQTINLRVFVYIHGGSFTTGNPNNIDVQFLIDARFIVVQLNYRLNALGFLSLGSSEVPGNAGLKDQTLALKWVKDNVGYFGGDANNIMLVGGSAGAAAVQLQQISPTANGLFSKCVTISGASECDWAIQANPIARATQLANALGLDINDPNFLANIRAQSAASIVTAASQVQSATLPTAAFDLAFGPVIETVRPGAFLTITPKNAYATGNYAHVPMLIGACSKEGLLTFGVSVPLAAAYVASKRSIVPLRWQRERQLSDNAVNVIYNIIIQQYFGSLSYNLANSAEDREHAIDLVGDVSILKPTEDMIRDIRATSTANIYHYIMSFMGVLNGFYMSPWGTVGATHGNEILFAFRYENPIVGETTQDGWMRRRYIKILDNFATYGNPTPGSCTPLLPTEWLPVTNNQLNFMELNGAFTSSVDPANCRMQFWRNLETQVNQGTYDNL